MPTHQDYMKAAVALGSQLGKGVAILAHHDLPFLRAKLGIHTSAIPHSAAAALLHQHRDGEVRRERPRRSDDRARELDAGLRRAAEEADQEAHRSSDHG